ncbi:MAG TPA: hypothetical protein VFA60_07385 [Terriglobales bacterium]|nr:hypothetical protein [Terriglobales bacterium]
MKTIALSLLLAFLPILGVVYIIFSGDTRLSDLTMTVDGLFTIIILLSISAVFGLNALLDLHSSGLVRIPGLKAPEIVASYTTRDGLKVEKGMVRELSFYESSVGQQNKTIVDFLPDGAKAPRLIAFLGNVRDQLPVGARLAITYRADPEGNVLVDREKLFL